ncbi:MAG: SDR family oxidoreductase [Peptococcaceae bacterium]|nr:SDR family oxidoreductase [Peptococcaceae bacterium]
MSKVLVTGGAGFIGSHIVDKLIEEKHQVVVVDNLSTGKLKNVNKAAIFFKGDITETEKIIKIFRAEEPEYVIHHAAQISVQNSLQDPYFDATINILGTLNILQCCKDYGVKKIIYASSAAVYGDPKFLPIDEIHHINPLSPYGISKHTPEHFMKMYAKLFGLNYTVLRYSNVYGPRQDPQGEGGVVSIFMNNLLQGKPLIIYGDGNQTRDFIYVEDIAKANIIALSKGDREIFNICTTSQTSVNQLVQVLNQINQSNVRPVYHPQRQGDIKDSYLSNKKALSELYWKPEFSLYRGLELTYKYYSLIYDSEERVTA